MSYFIFVTGGVVSSLGKGITTASIGLILKQMGYSVMIKKLDPYLNVDPGTMSPSQHGEVFITDDGMECDMDLGHYERFTGVNTSRDNNITSGKIYQTLIENERRGAYLGATVQTIPHVTNLIKDFIFKDAQKFDFILCEIGGTVGDIEALPFFEAARQIKQKLRHEVAFIHLTYVPFLEAAKELKTKPTQHSVKELMSIGIVPDILICRSSVPIGAENKRKIALFCNVEEEAVIEAPDMGNIYSIPLSYVAQGLHKAIAEILGLQNPKEPELSRLEALMERINKAGKRVRILIAGKYGTKDSYKSLLEAISHAGFYTDVVPEVVWLNTKQFDAKPLPEALFEGIDALIVPGGFGEDGLQGKIKVLQRAREQNIPTLGICLGLQMMVIEFARNVLGMKGACSEEFAGASDECVVGLMKSFERDGKQEVRTKDSDLGGTMRLGAYTATLKNGSLAEKIYGKSEISERHRHRYEIFSSIVPKFETAGFSFSGIMKGGNLPEIGEITALKYYIGVQFHPEIKSKLFEPHPIFVNLLEAAKTTA